MWKTFFLVITCSILIGIDANSHPEKHHHRRHSKGHHDNFLNELHELKGKEHLRGYFRYIVDDLIDEWKHEHRDREHDRHHHNRDHHDKHRNRDHHDRDHHNRDHNNRDHHDRDHRDRHDNRDNERHYNNRDDGREHYESDHHERDYEKEQHDNKDNTKTNYETEKTKNRIVVGSTYKPSQQPETVEVNYIHDQTNIPEPDNSTQSDNSTDDDNPLPEPIEITSYAIVHDHEIEINEDRYQVPKYESKRPQDGRGVMNTVKEGESSTPSNNVNGEDHNINTLELTNHDEETIDEQPEDLNGTEVENYIPHGRYRHGENKSWVLGLAIGLPIGIIALAGLVIGIFLKRRKHSEFIELDAGSPEKGYVTHA